MTQPYCFVFKPLTKCDMTQSYQFVFNPALTCPPIATCDKFVRATWLIHMFSMPHSHVWHASFVRVTGLKHTETPFIQLWLAFGLPRATRIATSDSFIRVTWLMRICDTPLSYVWHGSTIPKHFVSNSDVPSDYHVWPTHMSDMNHSYARHASFACLTWLNRTIPFNLILICPRVTTCDSFIRVTWLIHMCDVTDSCVWHNFAVYVCVCVAV